MITRPAATVRAWSDPATPEALRVTVACPFRTTILERTAGPTGLPSWVKRFVTEAAFRHAGECGRCDVEGVHKRGSRWLRGTVERARADYSPHARRN